MDCFVIFSVPGFVAVTIYFPVPSTVPLVPSGKIASYVPTSVPDAPTVIFLKSASTGAPVKPETLFCVPS